MNLNPPNAPAAGENEHAPGRLNGAGPVAIVDIGSNSVRLVVYEHLSRAATPLFNEKELCGLARGVATRGVIRDSAIEETLTAVRRFVAISQRWQARSLHVLATAAAREAANGPSFIAAVEDITGGEVQVLSGRHEARLSALGIVSGFCEPQGVAGDLGGGSLEVVSVSGDAVGAGETTPLGVIRLEELSGGSTKKAAKLAAETLSRSSVLAAAAGQTFYAIGGTWRALARLHMRQKGYPLHIMHNYVLQADEAADFCQMLTRRNLDSIDSIDAVSRARRALLPFGAAVLGQLIRIMQPSSIVMSALGVREGLLYDLLTDQEKARDPLIAACQELALLRSRSPRYVEELVGWTGMALDAIGLDETDEERRLRQAACLLSDIGWRGHPEYRGMQSMDAIANSAFIGVDHPGRAYLALANFYRHEGLVAEALSPRIRELTSTRLMERARGLGAALRVAHVLAAARPGIINRTTIERRGDFVVLTLPSDLEALGGARVVRRLSPLARMAGREPAIVLE